MSDTLVRAIASMDMVELIHQWELMNESEHYGHTSMTVQAMIVIELDARMGVLGL